MAGPQQKEELAFKAPFVSLFFRGQQMFSVFLLVVLSATFGYLTYQSDAKANFRADQTDEKADSRAMATVITLEKLEAAINRVEGTQRANIYVLSLSQEERQKLNLLKPKELSEMQR
jgi:hypothetical protein